MAKHNIQTEQHFATLETEDIGNELQARIAMYYNDVQTTGQLELWKRSYNMYYKGFAHKGRLRTSGEQDEFTNISINHYRSLLQHKVSLTVKQRPTFEPRASNTDYKSQAQTILARGLLDYYLREKRLERVLKQAVEYSLRYGDGYVRAEWDAASGDVYHIDPNTNKEILEGDIKYEAFSPIDVVRDVSKGSADQTDWYIIRTFRNKFDLIAKYADTTGIEDEDALREVQALYDNIMSTTPKGSITGDSSIITYDTVHTDDVPVYEFYHKRTPAVPDGRMVTFLDSDTILIDSPLPYDNIPVYDLVPNPVDGTPFGYSVGFDLLPIQEAIDGLHSAVITNQKTFAVQLIALPLGSNVNEASLSEGLSVVFYDPKNVPGGGKPEAINLLSTPAEVFRYIQQLESLMETLSGINSVTRGNPEASLKSGAALALVQSMAIEFSAGLQQAYVALLEDVGTATINILKRYANTDRVASIVGKSNKAMMKTFTGDDLSEINRVTIDVGSALSRTTAGKLSILENLISAGLIKTQEQYLQVLQTGTLEPAIEGETAELMLIRSENEQLSEGIADIIAVATDSHKLHIMEHKTVLASPEARINPEIVQATLSHIQMHIDQLRETDPNLLMMLGQEPLSPELPTGDFTGPDAVAGDVMNPEDPLMQMAEGVNMPNMPTNPLTQEPYEPGVDVPLE